MHLKWLLLTTSCLLRVMFLFLRTLGIWQEQLKVTGDFLDIGKQYLLTGKKVYIRSDFYFNVLSNASIEPGCVILLLSIRKGLVRLFDKLDQGTMKEGKNLANRIIELHKRRYCVQLCFPFCVISYLDTVLWERILVIFSKETNQKKLSKFRLIIPTKQPAILNNEFKTCI